MLFSGSTGSSRRSLLAIISWQIPWKVLLLTFYLVAANINVQAVGRQNPTHKVYITTGDRKSNGSSWSPINVDILMTDRTGRASRTQSLVADNNSVRKGHTQQYDLTLADAEYIKSITMRRTDTIGSQDWYIDLVKIDYLDVYNDDDDDLIIHSSYFPVHRWLHHSDEITLSEFDSALPQDDENPEIRSKALKLKRETYIYSGRVHGGPPSVEILPDDERFTLEYSNHIFWEKSNFISTLLELFNNTQNFESLSDIEQLYQGDNFHVPEGMTDWTEDAGFGRLRLTGTNPGLIKVCNELPRLMEKAITDIVQNLPPGIALENSMSDKRVYMVDMSFMADIEAAEPMPGPVGLFYAADNDQLMPIAIQLTPDEDAPVFTPKDDHYTWMAAKMWFNVADGSHHEAAAHLGLTHMLIEAVGVASHRQLSQSHPVFRLLAPHIRYAMQINFRGARELLAPGATFDQASRVGRTGAMNIIKDRFSQWSLQSDGNFLNNLKKRGVNNITSLPSYHYRDDGKLLWVALQKYVRTCIRSFYGQGDTGDSRLFEDDELQGWVNELVNDCQIKGMPVKYENDTYYVENIDDLVEIVTVFIFTASVQHSAVNAGQYEQYGFPPNSPLALRGDWPRTKAALTEKDVVDMLPDKEQTMKIMMIVATLSISGPDRLGDFDVQYAYDPASLAAAEELRSELRDIESKLAQKNKRRRDKYRNLIPRYIPNCIAI